jgi:hypothetical protein
MARFAAKCSVNGGTGESGEISAERRSGFEVGLYSMIQQTGNEGEGIQRPSYTGKRCVMREK